MVGEDEHIVSSQPVNVRPFSSGLKKDAIAIAEIPNQVSGEFLFGLADRQGCYFCGYEEEILDGKWKSRAALTKVMMCCLDGSTVKTRWVERTRVCRWDSWAYHSGSEAWSWEDFSQPGVQSDATIWCWENRLSVYCEIAGGSRRYSYCTWLGTQ